MHAWLLPWALWLEQSGVGAAVRTSTWMYPAAEVGHLLGLGLLVGTAVAFDLRLLGVACRLPVDGLAGYLLPIARLGFGLSALTGALLFAANATTLLSGVFAAKVIAIATGVLNASIFHRGVYRSVPTWNTEVRPPAGARTAAVISLLSWLVAITCGRLLAYV
jgi:hypothetical protein